MERERLIAAISEDIVNRREAMDDFFRLEVDSEAVSDRVHRAIDRFWGTKAGSSELQGAQDEILLRAVRVRMKF
jgi:hypothetical protein